MCTRFWKKLRAQCLFAASYKLRAKYVIFQWAKDVWEQPYYVRLQNSSVSTRENCFLEIRTGDYWCIKYLITQRLTSGLGLGESPRWSCLTLQRSWKACVWMTWGRCWTMRWRLSSCSSVERLLTCWAHLTSGRLPMSCSLLHSVVTAFRTVWTDDNYQLSLF